MTELKTIALECAGCTAPLSEAIVAKGVHKCPYCGYVNILPKQEQSSEVLHYLRTADIELKNGDFERAYNAYFEASKLDSEESKAYFGMALAANRVKHVKDVVNNRWQAICCEVTEKKFAEDSNYQKALEYATDEQRAEYTQRAAEIDYIREKFVELEKSGLSYDTFICVKVSDGQGGFTPDSHWAGKIYDNLKKSGLKPFYSEREIGDRTGEDYEALILYALYSSKSMLIVCSNEDYLRTPWVQNEYTRYYSMMSENDKLKNSIMIVFSDNVVERIPGIPGKIQGVALGSFGDSQKITEFVSKFANAEERARKEAEEKARREAEQKAKEDAQQKMLEELQRKLEQTEEKIKNQAESYTPPYMQQQYRTPAQIAQEEAERKAREEAEKKEQEERIQRYLAYKAQRKKKIKKIIKISSISLSVAVVVALIVIWQTLFVMRVKYEKVDGGYAIYLDNAYETGGPKGTFEIPSTYKGEPVVAIKESGFSYSRKMTGITIPDSVTSIGDGAFYCCESLTEINFNATAMNDLSEDNYVFSSTGENEKTVNIGKNVTKIPAYLFSSLQKITTVTFEEGSVCESIGDCAFYYCDSLTSITIPDSVTSIGVDAFYVCTSLTSITIPNSVTSIGAGAFSNCTSLTSVTIGNSVTSIGSYAFYSCKSLTSITIPDSVTSIGSYAFNYCTSLTSVTIPGSVTSIDSSAFYDCPIENATVPTNAISCIPEKNLKTVVINAGESIGVLAFSGCTSLTSITIPDSVTSIGESAFKGCTSLTSITIPDSVTSIEYGAFDDCDSLQTINCEVSSMPSGWEDAFSRMGRITINWGYKGE